MTGLEEVERIEKKTQLVLGVVEVSVPGNCRAKFKRLRRDCHQNSTIPHHIKAALTLVRLVVGVVEGCVVGDDKLLDVAVDETLHVAIIEGDELPGRAIVEGYDHVVRDAVPLDSALVAQVDLQLEAGVDHDDGVEELLAGNFVKGLHAGMIRNREDDLDLKFVGD